jgi:choloylglycine hydrolase
VHFIPFSSLQKYTYACTTFFHQQNGQMVFGRNYDWVTGAGIVCTNLRGLQKTSMKMEDGNTLSWVSNYGSITFNQYWKRISDREA